MGKKKNSRNAQETVDWELTTPDGRDVYLQVKMRRTGSASAQVDSMSEIARTNSQFNKIVLPKKLDFIQKVRNQLAHGQKSERQLKKNYIFVIELLCRRADRDALIGDLLEAYDDVRKMHGVRRAKIWFRVQVFWTVMSCLKSRLRGIGMAAIGAAFTWIGGKIGF